MPPTAQYCLVIGRVFKLHPVFDEAVRKILDHNPSVYIVFIFEKVAAWNHIVMQRLAVTFGSDMMNRIRLGRYQRYTDLIVHADVMLDTFPYGGKSIYMILCYHIKICYNVCYDAFVN